MALQRNLEPVVGNGSFAPIDAVSLVGFAKLREYGALVFDEVMTGFRIAYGGRRRTASSLD